MPYYNSKLRKQTDSFISMLRQKPGQTALSFAQEVISTGRNMYPDANEDTALKWLMMTADPWVMHVSLIRQPQTVDQFLDILYSIDSYTLMRHGCVGPFSKLEEIWALRGNGQQPLESSSAGNNDRATESRITCYYCYQRGHRHANCPQLHAQNLRKGNNESFGYTSGYANQSKTYQNSSFKTNRDLRTDRASQSKGPHHSMLKSASSHIDENVNHRKANVDKASLQSNASHQSNHNNAEIAIAPRKKKQKFLEQLKNKTKENLSCVEHIGRMIIKDNFPIGYLTKQEDDSSTTEDGDKNGQKTGFKQKSSISKKNEKYFKGRVKLEITESGTIYQDGVHIGHTFKVENESLALKCDDVSDPNGSDYNPKQNDSLEHVGSSIIELDEMEEKQSVPSPSDSKLDVNTTANLKLGDLVKQDTVNKLIMQGGLEVKQDDSSLTNSKLNAEEKDLGDNSKQRELNKQGDLKNIIQTCELEEQLDESSSSYAEIDCDLEEHLDDSSASNIKLVEDEHEELEEWRSSKHEELEDSEDTTIILQPGELEKDLDDSSTPNFKHNEQDDLVLPPNMNIFQDHDHLVSSSISDSLNEQDVSAICPKLNELQNKVNELTLDDMTSEEKLEQITLSTSDSIKNQALDDLVADVHESPHLLDNKLMPLIGKDDIPLDDKNADMGLPQQGDDSEKISDLEAQNDVVKQNSTTKEHSDGCEPVKLTQKNHDLTLAGASSSESQTVEKDETDSQSKDKQLTGINHSLPFTSPSFFPDPTIHPAVGRGCQTSQKNV